MGKLAQRKGNVLALPGTISAINWNPPANMSFEDWVAAGETLQRAERAVMWWLGDWWNFGDKHEFCERAAQAGHEYSYQALANAGWVAREIESSRRREKLSFNHHAEVAGLESKEQDALLEEAVIKSWTIREIRHAARLVKAARIARTHASFPTGKYRIFYADPPWSYSNEQPAGITEQADHYPLMALEQISALPIAELAEENAVLFLWATSPILEESFEVIRAWKFDYKTSFVWDKVKHNMGHYNSVRHEFLLVATRGACTPDVAKLFDSVVTEERTTHSAKPAIFYEIIETLYPHGKRIELFGRTRRDGWDSYGNEPPRS